jgi:HEAT repeat protein
MSAARTVLTVAAAVVILPLAMKAREVGSARASLVPLGTSVSEEKEPQATASDVQAYLEGLRGANAIQCEIALSSFNSWSSSRAPDRDSVAWNVATVIHRRIASEQIVAELVAAMRSPDNCVARIAARLLGRSKLAAARAALRTALRDENAQVRRLGAIGIGFSDDSTASSHLVRALADSDERVRAAAAWALGAVN